MTMKEDLAATARRDIHWPEGSQSVAVLDESSL